MPLMIVTPGLEPELSFEFQSILDTGSDCTLVPFDFLAKGHGSNLLPFEF
jgi:hypothetical protein